MNQDKPKNSDVVQFDEVPQVKNSIPVIGGLMPDAVKTLQTMVKYDNIRSLSQYGEICRIGNTVYVNDIELVMTHCI